MDMPTKHCPGCDKNLHLMFFSKKSSNKDGVYSICRGCRSAQRKTNIVKREKEGRRHEKTNSDRFYIKQKSAGYGRYRVFGISQADFEALLMGQNNACAICKHDVTGPKQAHVDHDHITGRIRGILCVRCNRGLGLFKDDPERLKVAISYLES